MSQEPQEEARKEELEEKEEEEKEGRGKEGGKVDHKNNNSIWTTFPEQEPKTNTLISIGVVDR